MSEVLYRKYRSRTFAEIEGQPSVVAILQQAVKSQSLAHAYLFAGPRGTGKTSMARIMAKAVNCQNLSKQGDVCNECENCQAIESGSYIDLIEIDAASNRGIEEIRALKENINYLPTRGNYKVYIIDEVHMLTREAFNALLKTLEEPPAHVIFILATTEPHKLPVTILSRVQRHDFRLASQQELQSKLARIVAGEEKEVDAAAYDVLHRYSEGSYRDAESILAKAFASLEKGNNKITVELLSDALGLAPEDQVAELISLLLAGDASKATMQLDKLQSGGANLAQLVTQLINLLHEQIRELVTGSKSHRRELQVLGALLQVYRDMRQIDNVRLLLDNAAFQLKLESEAAVDESDSAVTKPKQIKAEKTDELTEQAKSEAEPEKEKDPKPVSSKAVKVPAIRKKVFLRGKLKGGTKESKANNSENSKDLEWKQVLLLAKKADFKLWAALKICTPSFADNKLTLNISYAPSAALLQNEEAMATVNELVANVFGEDVVVDVETIISTIVPETDSKPQDSQAGSQLVESNEELVEELL